MVLRFVHILAETDSLNLIGALGDLLVVIERQPKDSVKFWPTGEDYTNTAEYINAQETYAHYSEKFS